RRMLRMVRSLLFILLFVPALWAGWRDDKPKSATPEETYKAFKDELRKVETEAGRKVRAAKTAQEAEKIKEDYFKLAREKYVPRAVSFAEEFPTSAPAAEALQFVLLVTPDGQYADKAVDLLLKNHADKLAGLCESIGRRGTPAAEHLLRGVLAGQHAPAL